MTKEIRQSLWRQLGASIDMLSNAISSCPEGLFLTNKRFHYIAYHTVIFLDYYLSIPPKDFSPFLTFTIKNPDERPEGSIGDLIPDKVYSKPELLDYIKASREKCIKIIEELTDEKLTERFTEDFETGSMDYPVLEILLYNMRHVQHHTAQLNLLIRQDADQHTEWIFRADDKTE